MQDIDNVRSHHASQDGSLSAANRSSGTVEGFDAMTRLKAAVDALRDCALRTAVTMEDLVGITEFACEVQQESVRLSLLAESHPEHDELERMSQQLNRGAQCSLSALRRIVVHAEQVLSSIERSVLTLEAVGQHHEAAASLLRKERVDAARDRQHREAAIVQMTRHAQSITEALDAAWRLPAGPQVRESH